MECPYFGDCQIDRELLESYDMENFISNIIAFGQVMCKGDQWRDCVRYKTNTDPFSKNS